MIQMKKLLIICILIVSIIFISGCTSEDKTKSETSTYSQSSGSLINPTNLLEGYYSSNYKTYATYNANSYIPFSSMTGGDISEYSGEVPTGMKRIRTNFILENEDSSIKIEADILEFDSNANVKEMISQIGDQMDAGGASTTRDLVGDYSVQYSEQVSSNSLSVIYFSADNILVRLTSGGEGISKEKIEIETLKVAKAIKGKID
jgi:hypothetical protein